MPEKTENPKEVKIFDYTYSQWGRALFVDEKNKTASGFYPVIHRNRPEEGSIVYKVIREEQKEVEVWLARLHDIVWMKNPSDAYNCKYELIEDLTTLTQQERNALKEDLLRWHGISLPEGV